MATKSTEKVLTRFRRWLRPISSTGPQTSVHGEVRVHLSSHQWIQADLCIRDCSHSVVLDFYSQEPKHVNKHIAVLRSLKRSIEEITEGLEQARAMMEDHEKENGQDNEGSGRAAS